MLSSLVTPDSPSMRLFPECKFILDSALSSDFDSSDDEFDTNSVPIEQVQIQTDYDPSILKQYSKRELTRNISLKQFLKIQNSVSLTDRNLAQKLIIKCSVLCGFDDSITGLASKMFDYLLCTMEFKKSDLPLLAGTCVFMANKLDGEEIFGVCEKIANIIGTIDETSIINSELKILTALKFNTQFITPLMYAEVLKSNPEFLTTTKLSEQFETITNAIIYSTLLNDKCFDMSGETIALAALKIAKAILTNQNLDQISKKIIEPVKDSIVKTLLTDQNFIYGLFPSIVDYLTIKNLSQL